MKKLPYLIMLFTLLSIGQTAEKEPGTKSVAEILAMNKQAMGSQEAMDKINNRVVKSSMFTITKTGNIESETNTKMVQVITRDGRLSTTTSSDGNIISKVVFNGDSGYTVLPSLGHRQDFSPQQIATFKNAAKLFQDFDVNDYKKEVEIVDVNGEKTYHFRPSFC
jgi:hypothetical protein